MPSLRKKPHGSERPSLFRARMLELVAEHEQLLAEAEFLRTGALPLWVSSLSTEDETWRMPPAGTDDPFLLSGSADPDAKMSKSWEPVVVDVDSITTKELALLPRMSHDSEGTVSQISGQPLATVEEVSEGTVSPRSGQMRANGISQDADVSLTRITDETDTDFRPLDSMNNLIAACRQSSGNIRQNSMADIVKGSRVTLQILDVVPAAVIVLNAITLAISADYWQGSIVWDIFEVIFVSTYFLECVVKIWLFGFKWYFCAEGHEKHWNWFDFTCLVLSIIDLIMTYIVRRILPGVDSASFFKVLRLCRIARILRALHYRIFDELKAMVNGVIAGVRVLLWAIILLMVTMFILGLLMNHVSGDDIDEFATVPRAMFTVFRCYTDGCVDYDGSPLHTQLFQKYGAPFFIGYMLVFMLVTVGIFNLIMAIFIDDVMRASLTRKLYEIGASHSKTQRQLLEVCVKLLCNDDAMDGDGLMSQAASEQLRDIILTRAEFEELLQHKKMKAWLVSADIETSEQSELFDTLDVDMSGQLSFFELMAGLMRMRGPITKSDIVALRLKVRYITGMIEAIWQHIVLDNDEARAASQRDNIITKLLSDSQRLKPTNSANSARSSQQSMDSRLSVRSMFSDPK